MIPCPIASQVPHRADALACSTLTYGELDTLIRKMASRLKDVPTRVVSIVPKGTVEDIAFFFAAFRLGLCVYPLSFRLPEKEIRKRVRQASSTLASPQPGHFPLNVETIDPTVAATLLETSSGTKIASHTFNAHLSSAHAAIDILNVQSSDSYGLNLPLCHVAGIASIMRAFVSGARLLLKKEIHLATHLSAVSTQLYRYVQDGISFSKLKCMLIGGGPLAENLKKAPYPLFISYGMTEAASMIACNGAVLPHIEAKMEEGEVWIKGPSLLTHYLGEPLQKGWFQTGNTGSLQNGRLHISGRLDRVFISGGEKIQPEIIEHHLLKIPGVIQARVTSVAEREFGHVPKATIHADREISSLEITEKLREVVPNYMIPKEIENSLMSESKLSKLS